VARNVVHLTHRREIDVVVVACTDMYGGFGALTLGGTKGLAQATFQDTYYAFKTQLEAFVQYLRSGERPFPHVETEELMRLVIAGIQSREQAGAPVNIAEVR
jgi:hypothetical protein